MPITHYLFKLLLTILYNMNEIKNKGLVDLINKILADPGDEIPVDLRQPLIDYLCDASLICPVFDDNIIFLSVGPRTFIPASCDIENFKRIFRSGETPKVFKFSELSHYLNDNIDGIMINPGSFGFIINPNLAEIIFNKNSPVVSKGYDVKVRLNDLRPIHWRDLIIPENITFYELDNILKTLWGFNGYHMSMFFIKNADIHIMDKTIADSCMDFDFHDSKTTKINDFFERYKKITYWYDFGDDWQFDIEIKKIVDYDKDYVTIKRFKGKYNPIEDCGGVYGLSGIIECAENSYDDGYFSDLVEYLNEFDMDYAQNLLKNKIYIRRSYE